MPGVFAEVEPTQRRERRAEGIAIAKTKADDKAHPPKIDTDEIKRRLPDGKPPADGAHEKSLARKTVNAAKAEMTA